AGAKTIEGLRELSIGDNLVQRIGDVSVGGRLDAESAEARVLASADKGLVDHRSHLRDDGAVAGRGAGDGNLRVAPQEETAQGDEGQERWDKRALHDVFSLSESEEIAAFDDDPFTEFKPTAKCPSCRLLICLLRFFSCNPALSCDKIDFPRPSTA